MARSMSNRFPRGTGRRRLVRRAVVQASGIHIEPMAAAATHQVAGRRILLAAEPVAAERRPPEAA